MCQPLKISIITATFNCASTIPDTLESLQSQTHTSIEHIVVDGASSDDTLSILSTYRHNISKLISKPDDGIYDAMNKGIRLATGDIIGFLNADDFYAGPQVLEKVANVFANPEIDACYSDLIYVHQENKDRIVRYWKSCQYHDGLFEKGWMPPHPTFFARRKVYKQFGMFDLDFRIAADVELMMRFLARQKIRSAYLPQVTVHMRLGGETNKSIRNIFKQNIEILHALKKNTLRASLLFPVYKLIEKIPQFFRRPSL